MSAWRSRRWIGFRQVSMCMFCVDAVGSRSSRDHETALRRLENFGAIPTTTEAVLFEWCEKAGTENFKKISQLVKSSVAVHEK